MCVSYTCLDLFAHIFPCRKKTEWRRRWMHSKRRCVVCVPRSVPVGNLKLVLKFIGNGSRGEHNGKLCWISWSKLVETRTLYNVIEPMHALFIILALHAQYDSICTCLVFVQDAFKKEIEHIQKKARRTKIHVTKGFYSKEKMRTELGWSASIS